MNNNEIAKDIVIALIAKGYIGNVESVCSAYKKIIKAVDNPN